MDLVSQDIHEHFRYSGGRAECKARDRKMTEADFMNKHKLSIWGRNFELPLIYECYPDEEIIKSQREVFGMFEANQDAAAVSLEPVKNYVKTDESAQSDGVRLKTHSNMLCLMRSLCCTPKSTAILQSCATIGLIWNMELQFYLRTDSSKTSNCKIKPCKQRKGMLCGSFRKRKKTAAAQTISCSSHIFKYGIKCKFKPSSIAI